jgi:hypothetical protein
MGDIYTEAVCQLQELDALSISKDNSISFVGDRIADMERMLRNYELFVRSSMLNGTFDSEIEATRVFCKDSKESTPLRTMATF